MIRIEHIVFVHNMLCFRDMYSTIFAACFVGEVPAGMSLLVSGESSSVIQWTLTSPLFQCCLPHCGAKNDFLRNIAALYILHVCRLCFEKHVQDLAQIVTNDFKTELREENHWLLFAPIPVVILIEMLVSVNIMLVFTEFTRRFAPRVLL